MFTGAFAELDALRKQFAHIATGSFRRDMSESMAWEARRQADIGFERSVDPYDNPWPALKYRSGKAVDDEGHLRRVITGPATVFEHGFIISTRGAQSFDSVRHAATQQYGAHIRARGARGMRFRVGGTTRTNGNQWVTAREVTVPRRQFMPEGRLGARWDSALTGAAHGVMQRTMGAPWGAL